MKNTSLSHKRLLDYALGLLSAALATQITRDLREVLLVLPLFLRASEILGRDSIADFKATTRTMNQEASKVILDFANRSPENRTIEVMGYIESSDVNGFRFQRTW